MIPGGNEEVMEDDVDFNVLKGGGLEGVEGWKVKETISEGAEL